MNDRDCFRRVTEGRAIVGQAERGRPKTSRYDGCHETRFGVVRQFRTHLGHAAVSSTGRGWPKANQGGGTLPSELPMVPRFGAPGSVTYNRVLPLALKKS